jgi:hypothetical protein
MRRIYSTWLTLASLVLVACGTHHDEGAGDQEGPQQDASVSGAPGGFSGAGASAGVGGSSVGAGSDANDGYRVAINARATVICPGECTELTAEAMNGHPPYTYAWSDQLGEGAGPHRVCPESTTTYAVMARDTALEGDEFERPSRSAEARIGIVVDESDALGCAPPDAGPPAEPGVTTVQCTFPITYEGSAGATPLIFLESGSTLATDAEGNLYFAGTFQGVVDLGSGPTEHHVTDSGFVAKYDGSCQPVWVRTFGALEAHVELRALDVAPDGTVVAGGKLGGTLEIDGQTLSPGRPSLLVLSLDGADGSVTRATTYESPYGDGMIHQLAVDGQGEIVFGGQTGGNVVIDGVTIEGPEVEGLMVFLAKVSATGQYRFGYQVTGSDVAHFAVRDDGTIALTSWAWINVQFGPADGILPLESSGTHRFVVLLDADGLAKWWHSLDSLAGWSDTTWPAGTVAFDRDGNVLVEHGNLGTLESIGDIELSELLSKYDGSGELIWSRAVSPSSWRSNKAPEGSIATDSHGNIVQTLELPNPDEAPPSGWSGHPDHVMVQKLTPDGTVTWQHTFATDPYENAFGVTVAPDDSIWVGHGVDTGYRPNEGTLRISKLAP